MVRGTYQCFRLQFACNTNHCRLYNQPKHTKERICKHIQQQQQQPQQQAGRQAGRQQHETCLFVYKVKIIPSFLLGAELLDILKNWCYLGRVVWITVRVQVSHQPPQSCAACFFW